MLRLKCKESMRSHRTRSLPLEDWTLVGVNCFANLCETVLFEDAVRGVALHERLGRDDSSRRVLNGDFDQRGHLRRHALSFESWEGEVSDLHTPILGSRLESARPDSGAPCAAM